ncbi:hypothetical protein MMC27_008890 [Xylographa pallens]|nr:hypothetical protein [Xylographa pallens]
MQTTPQNSRLTSPAADTATPFLPLRSPDARFHPPSRWSLTAQARILRFLARIGFYLHTFPKPYPPAPSFSRSFTSTALDGSNSATLELAFYVPADYHRETQRGRRYPLVVNYHGGGFTMGRTSDDARWAATVVRAASAVVVGVAYRLAPKHPFPTAVEDGVCALLHLAAHADSLGVDTGRICLSGFSAGGNLAFAIPLRLQAHLRTLAPDVRPPLPCIVAIIAWYPNVDNRLTRAQRRAASVHPSKTLPPTLTTLFDASYFPSEESVGSPYASPAAATDDVLVTALPDHIALYLCEWDMLLQEGREFGERLEGLGKRVRCEVIKERKHAFDKSPWPFGLDWKVGAYYTQACGWLVEAIGDL